MNTVERWFDRFSHMSPEGIRDFLKAEKAFGVRGDAARCPLAMFLTRILPPGTEVRVGTSMTWFRVNKGGRRFIVDNPASVKAFTSQVDGGRYPELDSLCMNALPFPAELFSTQVALVA